MGRQRLVKGKVCMIGDHFSWQECGVQRDSTRGDGGNRQMPDFRRDCLPVTLKI